MSMNTPIEHAREPCPWRILDDTGGAFAMGCLGGGLWHSFKGAKNAPKGERVRGSLVAVKARAPVIGGNFAVWGGLFSTFDCGIAGLRKKEDPWNAIMSGAMTGGVLAARQGMSASLRSAVLGGVLLAIFEGIGLVLSRYGAEQARQQQLALLKQAQQQRAQQIKEQEELQKQKMGLSSSSSSSSSSPSSSSNSTLLQSPSASLSTMR